MEISIPEPPIDPEILKTLPEVVKASPWLLYGQPDTQGKPFSPRLDVSQSQKDAISRGTVLLEHDGIQIIHPENPLVEEESEGLHLRVEAKDVPAHPKTPEEWKRWIKAWEMAIGAGKIVTEAQTSKDLWVSFSGEHDFSPGDHLAIEIFGRRPESPSWGRTVPMPTDPKYDHRTHRLPDEAIKGIEKTMRQYFHEYWIPLLEYVGVSPFPVDRIDPSDPKFIEKNMRDPEKPFFWKNELVFSTSKFNISACIAAHVRSGVHMMVEYNPDYAPIRPWEKLSDSMDGLIMTEMMGQILSETQYNGQPIIDRWKNSLTGSWFSKFYDLDHDQAFLEARHDKWKVSHLLRGKAGAKYYTKPPGTTAEKDAYGIPFWVPSKSEWRTKAHWHMLGARKGESMQQFEISVDKGESEWAELQGIGMDEIRFIREILNKELPTRIASAFPEESPRQE